MGLGAPRKISGSMSSGPVGILQTGCGGEICSCGFRCQTRGCASREAKYNSSESQPCNYSSNIAIIFDASVPNIKVVVSVNVFRGLCSAAFSLFVPYL